MVPGFLMFCIFCLCMVDELSYNISLGGYKGFFMLNADKNIADQDLNSVENYFISIIR